MNGPDGEQEWIPDYQRLVDIGWRRELRVIVDSSQALISSYTSRLAGLNVSFTYHIKSRSYMRYSQMLLC